jgi:hypothetical protein
VEPWAVHLQQQLQAELEDFAVWVQQLYSHSEMFVRLQKLQKPYLFLFPCHSFVDMDQTPLHEL